MQGSLGTSPEAQDDRRACGCLPTARIYCSPGFLFNKDSLEPMESSNFPESIYVVKKHLPESDLRKRKIDNRVSCMNGVKSNENTKFLKNVIK